MCERMTNNVCIIVRHMSAASVDSLLGPALVAMILMLVIELGETTKNTAYAKRRRLGAMAMQTVAAKPQSELKTPSVSASHGRRGLGSTKLHSHIVAPRTCVSECARV